MIAGYAPFKLESAARAWLILLLGLVAVVLLYLPGLSGAFFFDDHPNVVRNPAVAIGDLSWASLHQAWSSGISGQFGRPVSQLSFALNHYFSGFSPFAFKLTNLALHCASAVLIYTLARQVLDSLRGRLRVPAIGLYAAFVALAWALHPIQMTSVLYVVQRMTSLSAFFLLFALVLHVNGRRTKGGAAAAASFLLAWGVFWPLSVLSKETGVLLPGFVAIYELMVRRCEHGGLDRFGRLAGFASLFLAIGLAVFLMLPSSKWIFAGYAIRSFSLAERLLTEARVIWEYVDWIVLPDLDSFGLFHDDIRVSRGLTDPWTTLPALIGVVALLALPFVAATRFPLVAFGVAWFLVGHSLESTFLPLEIAHEHRNYLPLFGLLFLPVAAADSLGNRPGPWRTLVLVSMIAVLSYLAFVTALRADMFANERMRAQLEAQFHPESPRANYEAGRTLASLLDEDRGKLMVQVLSKMHFEKAMRLDPDFKMPMIGLVTLSCGLSGTVDRVALNELQRRLSESLILQEDTSILSSIVEMAGAGLSCLERADIDALFAAFLANPTARDDKRVAMNLLHADYLWLAMRDLPAARAALKNALDLAPRHASARLKWAQLDYIAGERAAAMELLRELRNERLSPGERDTLKNLMSSMEPDGLK